MRQTAKVPRATEGEAAFVVPLYLRSVSLACAVVKPVFDLSKLRFAVRGFVGTPRYVAALRGTWRTLTGVFRFYSECRVCFRATPRGTAPRKGRASGGWHEEALHHVLRLRVLVGEGVLGRGQPCAAGGAPRDAAPTSQNEGGHLGVEDEHVQGAASVGAGDAGAAELRDEGLQASPCRMGDVQPLKSDGAAGGGLAALRARLRLVVAGHGVLLPAARPGASHAASRDAALSGTAQRVERDSDRCASVLREWTGAADYPPRPPWSR